MKPETKKPPFPGHVLAYNQVAMVWQAWMTAGIENPAQWKRSTLDGERSFYNVRDAMQAAKREKLKLMPVNNWLYSISEE